MNTAIDAAQDALLDVVSSALLTCWLTPTPDADLGFPAGGLQDEHVWIGGDVADAGQEYRLSSLNGKDETFTLHVHALSTVDGNEYTDPRDRAKTMTDAIETALQKDPTLGGAVMLAQVSGVEVDDAIPSSSKRQVMRTLSVACQAWLTP